MIFFFIHLSSKSKVIDIFGFSRRNISEIFPFSNNKISHFLSCYHILVLLFCPIYFSYKFINKKKSVIDYNRFFYIIKKKKKNFTYIIIKEYSTHNYFFL